MNRYRCGSFTSRSAQAIDEAASAMPRKRTQSWSMHRSRGSERIENGGRGPPQIRSGNRMMKLSRLGIFTFGSVSAFIVSFSPMILLRARR